MTVRFFILQAHYRSSLDFSNEALQAAAKGLARLRRGLEALEELGVDGAEPPDFAGTSGRSGNEVDTAVIERCEGVFRAMSDDFGTPQALSGLFELASDVHRHRSGEAIMGDNVLELVAATVRRTAEDILGLELAQEESGGADREDLVQLLVSVREEARSKKDFATGDRIRDGLLELGVKLVDSKEGTKVEYVD
jgi:cysteinyl-tRNA synthetase